MEGLWVHGDRLDWECLGVNALLGEDPQGYFDSIFGGELGVAEHLGRHSVEKDG